MLGALRLRAADVAAVTRQPQGGYRRRGMTKTLQAARRLGLSPQRIDFWRRRGWLAKVPSPIAGQRGAYRLGDVRRVAAAPKPAGWPLGRKRGKRPAA